MYSYKFITEQSLRQKQSYFTKESELIRQRCKDILEITINWNDYYSTVNFIIKWNKQTNMLNSRFNVNQTILTMLNNQYVHNFSIKHYYIE